jgi:serine/threonine-protein phosphatase 2A regulatory subunit A
LLIDTNHTGGTTKAVESIAKIVTSFSGHQMEDFYIPMVKRLSTGDWFTSRTSACGLYAPGYQMASSTTQDELRRYVIHTIIPRNSFHFSCSLTCGLVVSFRMYAQLCHDDTPMVRRAAATNLAVSITEFLQFCPNFNILTFLS